MVDWAKQHLSQGQTFKKSAAVQWFAEHYQKLKSDTVNMHSAPTKAPAVDIRASCKLSCEISTRNSEYI
jgi:hypothetical protein